jgi:hypothetical protein
MRNITPRKCFHCLIIKPPTDFPLAPSGRCRKVCFDCVASEQAERERRRLEREARSAARTWEQDGVTVRKCFRCEEVSPLEEGFAVNRRRKDGSIMFSYECKRCCSARASEYKKWALKNKPGHRERHNELNRAWRERNPEAARAAGRRWVAKRSTDPEWVERRNESKRLAYALRRLSEGKAIRRSPLRAVDTAPTGRVPARQLATVIDRLIELERRQHSNPDHLNDETGPIVLERVLPGFSQEAAQRALYAWRNGERERVAFDTADLVLTAGGWFWWEVWNEDTVRRYRWRFELCRVRRKKNHSTGKVYVNLVRTRIWHSGDLGPDYAELARIEALFTGSTSTLKEVAA